VRQRCAERKLAPLRFAGLGVTRVAQLMHFTRGHAWALMCKTR
jgi:hypothetical protein